MASYDDAVLEPHLADFRGSGTRYPNPYFDLAQTYTPRTVKELFKWCSYFFYTTPLVGATITKISRYPITDFVVEDSDAKVKELWEGILRDHIKIKDRHMEINLDLNVYGNAFASVHLPFTRMLVCQSCGARTNIKEVAWTWKAYAFSYMCPKCSTNQIGDPDKPLTIKDVPYRSKEDVRVIRWNPENITIRYNEATGSSTYYYTVSPLLKHQITTGEREILEDLPLLFILSVKHARIIKMANENIFHLKRPTLAEKDMGWGKPLVYHVLKDLYYLATLRRAQEAIANEHIVPFDFIFPTPNAQMDPFVHSDLGNWKSRVEEAIKKHRTDSNYKAVMPVPVGFGRLGGDGKTLMLTPELNYLNQTIVGGMGIPEEFLFGGLNWCLAPRHNILTSKGMLKLEEICPTEIGTKAIEGVDVSTKDDIQGIAFSHRTELKVPYTVKTKLGIELTGSKIHKLWVLNSDMSMSWKHLEDIKTGEYVAVSKGDNLWGNKAPTKELCRLLGYLMAEGSITHHQVEFSNTDTNLMEDYCNCFKVLFGTKPSYWTRTYEGDDRHFGNKTVYQTQSKSSEVISYFRNLNVFGYSADKKVPRIIRESTKECVFEFMKALFEGNGCNSVSNNKQCIYYNSISSDLLEEVQLLLLNAGIVSSKYDRYQNEDGTYTTPGIQLRSEDAVKFLNEIGFVTKETDNSQCNPQGFRSEHSKVPYLLDRLKDLEKLTNGAGAWIRETPDVIFEKEVYTIKEAAALLGRDKSSILIYIRSGKLAAQVEERSDGRYASNMITADSIRKFISDHGVSKRAAIGQTTWEINANNESYVNWDGVKQLDPVLYKRYHEVKSSKFLWSEVVETTISSEMIEMCDLTVYNTHSYIANGMVSHNTGSSITLRSLQNDFLHNQTQLLDFTVWLKNKLRTFLKIPDIKTIRFLDFKMADDIQRIQQLIGLNAQRKVSDETMLTELGLDYEKENKKIIEEIQIQNKIQDLMARSQAKTSGEAQLITFNYQQKIQELQQKSLEKMQAEGMAVGPEYGGPMTAPGMEGEQSGLAPQLGGGQPMDAQSSAMASGEGQIAPASTYQDQVGQPIAGAAGTVTAGGQAASMDIHKMIKSWATKLSKLEPTEQMRMLSQLKQQMPQFGDEVEKVMNQVKTQGTVGGSSGGVGGQANPSGTQVNMNAMPVKGAPTRAGSA